MLRIHMRHGRHPSLLRTFFPVAEPDPFYDETVLSALYGDTWVSILVEDGRAALRHTFAASAIGNTGYYDIEPFVGYAGPIATPGASSSFLADALERYSSLCRENGIVAELVRFNPLLGNDQRFYGVSANLVIRPQKPVAFIPVAPDGDAQLDKYSATARNMIRLAQRRLSVRAVEKTPDVWEHFVSLLGNNLSGAGARPEWRFSPEFFDRLRRHPAFVLVAAKLKDRMVSAALALVHRHTTYYFLAASVRDPHLRRGAGNAVVHELTRIARVSGGSRLALGGGNSAAFSDSLFRFKRSFGGEVGTFATGFLSHNPVELAALIRMAEFVEPAARTSPLFLRYRLAPAFAGARMRPCCRRYKRIPGSAGQPRTRPDTGRAAKTSRRTE